MKLRNKKTGEIIETMNIGSMNERGEAVHSYSSLAELTEEWEDVPEEPKEDYIRVIESFIHYVEEADDSFYCDESVKKFIETLKAWKRLKNAGFEFKGYEGIWGETDDGACGGEGKIDFAVSGEFSPKDLDLIFGGEE